MKVIVTQPSLAKYRLAIFAELAAREGVEFELVHAEIPGITNVPAEGFDATFSPIRRLRTP